MIMQARNVTLTPLKAEDRESFILENQRAFKYGALEEFGKRDEHFEGDGEIISRETIEKCLAEDEVYSIRADGEIVGGLAVKVDSEKRRGELELIFVFPEAHSRGIGQAAWKEVEKFYPQIDVWETFTPCFEKRNVHFYVNKLGFHIVEFFTWKFHSFRPPADAENDGNYDDWEMFRFEKIIR